MKHFTPNEIADEVAKDFGLNLPKAVVRKLISHHIRFLFKTMKTKSDRIKMRNCDIHTIYTEINRQEMACRVADLDETKVPKREKNFVVKNKGFKNTMRHQKKFAKRVWQYEIPKINA